MNNPFSLFLFHLLFISERIHLQPRPMDSDKVHGLRVSVVVARFWLVHRPVLHAVHPGVHGLLVAGHSRHLAGGNTLFFPSSSALSVFRHKLFLLNFRLSIKSSAFKE